MCGVPTVAMIFGFDDLTVGKSSGTSVVESAFVCGKGVSVGFSWVTASGEERLVEHAPIIKVKKRSVFVNFDIPYLQIHCSLLLSKFTISVSASRMFITLMMEVHTL